MMIHYIKTPVLSILFCLALLSNADRGCGEVSLETIQAAFEKPVPLHPRLLFTQDQEQAVRRRIDTSAEFKRLYDSVIDRAEAELTTQPVERVLTGIRLLSVSRKCLSRTWNLSMAYRFTHDSRYLQRAEQEMLAAASFSDWHPRTYLDVAEMTAALAVGYDWLYDELAPESRIAIRNAIVEKGINPSLDEKAYHNWWLNNTNNWNPVCNGALTLGVLAIMEDHPELAKRLVHRAVNKVQPAMAQYEPDGAYPEGPVYWIYGTTYNVLMIAALESALQTDFGLSQKPGFSKTAEYYRHMIGPGGQYFNYSDCVPYRYFNPAVFWFSNRYRISGWARQELADLSRALEQKNSRQLQHYTNCLSLIWAQADSSTKQPSLCWMGRGTTPAAAFRTSWTDPDASYFAIKAGTPEAPHGHMDIGSFVFESNGVRWAVDLGPESYHKIESLGMNLWSSKQTSDRWTIFRYSNLSHNTLVVNGQLQQVKGVASITQFDDRREFPHVIIDMTAVYANQLNQAHRGGALLPTGQLLIQDELESTDQPATVRWAMATPAEIQIQSDRTALLTMADKTLRFEILSGPQTTQLKIISMPPETAYDAPNPGICMIGFDVYLKPTQKTMLAVLMTPQNATHSAVEPVLSPLADWSGIKN